MYGINIASDFDYCILKLFHSLLEYFKLLTQHQTKEQLQSIGQHTAFIAETGSHPPCCCCARSNKGMTADCL